MNQSQPRYQRHGQSRMSTAHSSAQAQPVSDAYPGSTAGTSGALLASARNTLINGGQFTAAANVNRNVTINISEGIAPEIQTESCHSRQTTNRRRNRRRGSMRPKPDPTGPVLRSNEIYERHLRLKKRGHPLWIPQPNMVLPIPYRAQGARIGDVGIFTENGGFDFLFNICVPRNDPINPAVLPENFFPIYPSVDPTDIRKFAEFSSGSYLASSSVAESRTGEQSSGLTFESSASEGAILTMPEGAYSEDLSNFSRFRQYIAIHAKDWYKFVNGPRGREAQNGDVRVVVGCDKTTSWGMATFANSSSSQDTNFRLKFTVSGEQPSQSECNAGNKYTWEHSGVAEVRVGPGRGENEELGETESNRLQNQCLFLRTLNVMLSEKVWREIFPESVVVADQNNSYSGIQDLSMGSPYGSSTGYSLPHSSQSHSSQNLPSRSHNSTVSSTSSDFTKFPANYGTFNDVDDLLLPKLPPFESIYDILGGILPPSMSPGEEDVLANTSKVKYAALASQAEEETDKQVSFDIPPNLSGFEEAQSESTPTPNVILTRSSSCNGILHPSNIINQYLLELAPDAKVAVTHDRDWSNIIGMASLDSYQSDPSQLIEHLLLGLMNDVVLNSYTGVVYLELKEIDQNNMSSEAAVAGIIESIKDGRFRLDHYLFGFHGDRRLHLQDLCKVLQLGSTNQLMPMFLRGHPERPFSLDELLESCDGNSSMQGSIQRQSIISLRAELGSPPPEDIERSNCLLRLGDALSRRYSQWAQRDDLEEAIWSYKKALSFIPESNYQYLESLLGLCSSLFQRLHLLGHADDLKDLLRYLELQSDMLNRWKPFLLIVEAQLKQFQHDAKPPPIEISPRQLRVHKSEFDDGWENDIENTRRRAIGSRASSLASSSTGTISSAGTSSSAFTRYSNSSAASVSTTPSSVSSTSWRTSRKPDSTTASTLFERRLPKNIKIMNSIPWELDQLPRGTSPNAVGDIFGSPPIRKRLARRPPPESKLLTISERPTERRTLDIEDASTGATHSDDEDDAVDTDPVKKVQKGQINALAKMLSALRR